MFRRCHLVPHSRPYTAPLQISVVHTSPSSCFHSPQLSPPVLTPFPTLRLKLGSNPPQSCAFQEGWRLVTWFSRYFIGRPSPRMIAVEGHVFPQTVFDHWDTMNLSRYHPGGSVQPLSGTAFNPYADHCLKLSSELGDRSTGYKYQLKSERQAPIQGSSAGESSLCVLLVWHGRRYFRGPHISGHGFRVRRLH